MNTKRFLGIIVLTIVGALLISACSLVPSPPEPPAALADEADSHDDGEHGHGGTHSPEQHMAGMHDDIPEEAAAVPNPIEATAESIAAGGAIFVANCAACHGESGYGDGPAAVALETQPANLYEGHVQMLSDGALFYIISHGKPDTPMPAWEQVLSEENRWQVVNFLRTFKEGQTEGHAEDDHHDDDAHHGEVEDDHHDDDAHHDDEGEHEAGDDHHDDDAHHDEAEDDHHDDDAHHDDDEGEN